MVRGAGCESKSRMMWECGREGVPGLSDYSLKRGDRIAKAVDPVDLMLKRGGAECK